MKWKLAVVSLVAATALSAKWFVGVEYPFSTQLSMKSEMKGQSETEDFDYKPLVVKVGAGTPGGWNMDVYYATGKLEFDNYTSDDPLNEIGYDIRREFGLDSVRGLAPYLQAGFSIGWMEMQDNDFIYYDQSVRLNFGLKAGAGIAYLLAEHFQFLLGVDYKYRVWQDIVYQSADGHDIFTLKTSDSGINLYGGLKLWF